jgi:hypothetical protein
MAADVMNEVAAATKQIARMLFLHNGGIPPLCDSQKALDVARGSCWRGRIWNKFVRDAPTYSKVSRGWMNQTGPTSACASQR